MHVSSGCLSLGPRLLPALSLTLPFLIPVPLASCVMLGKHFTSLSLSVLPCYLHIICPVYLHIIVVLKQTFLGGLLCACPGLDSEDREVAVETRPCSLRASIVVGSRVAAGRSWLGKWPRAEAVQGGWVTH